MTVGCMRANRIAHKLITVPPDTRACEDRINKSPSFLSLYASASVSWDVRYSFSKRQGRTGTSLVGLAITPTEQEQ